jgi:hypothetical protein
VAYVNVRSGATDSGRSNGDAASVVGGVFIVGGLRAEAAAAEDEDAEDQEGRGEPPVAERWGHCGLGTRIAWTSHAHTSGER